MSKTNFFVKFFKNIINLINSLLEKNLNKLNFKNFSYLLKNNKTILTFVAVFVVFISYLLLPTFYNQSEISKKLKFELSKKLDLNFNFSQDIKYNFFPKPHFITIESNILDGQNEISKINKLKIFISSKNFFSLKNIEVKDVIFENANFNLNKINHNFFLDLLENNFEEGNLTIKNSNIFFRNLEDEVLFINKILKMKYYHEPKELKNIFYSDNEIFNIPFSTQSFFNEDKSKIFSQINLNLMKLKIKNEISFYNEKKVGKSEFMFNKLKQVAKYQIKKDYFEFHVFDKQDEPKISYKGEFNLKPFYASLNGDLDKINFNYLFGSNAIISQLLKTEIFNNKNIDFKLNINADNIYNNGNFKNIKLKSKIQEGLIDTDNTKFEWKNFADFELFESLIYVKNGELVLDGRLKININDYKAIYKFFLTPKKYRGKIEQVDLNFTYNFDNNVAILKDIKIDNEINQNVNRVLNNVILKKSNFQNKIYLKNLINEAFKNYAG
tara:strand:+ start:59 stop:1549 length:1491 start_codon:yes stop_codon:yes gene_type:complete